MKRVIRESFPNLIKKFTSILSLSARNQPISLDEEEGKGRRKKGVHYSLSLAQMKMIRRTKFLFE